VDGRVTNDAYIAERNRKIRLLIRKRMERLEEFEATWAYVFPLVKPRTEGLDVDSWCRANLDAVLDEDEMRAEVTAWAAANLSEYEIHEKFIGMNDPVAAFWFKVTWQ
jgi:hypothetical protein